MAATEDYLPSGAPEAPFNGLKRVRVRDDWTGELVGIEWQKRQDTDPGKPERVQLRRPRVEEQEQAEAMYDLATSRQGFRVESFSRAAVLPVTCRYCGGPLPLPNPDEWFCEFGDKPWGGCRCNWCTIREEKLLRNPGGQPKICKSAECRRKAATERQRRWRNKKRKLATV